ncbi:MAG: ABC transporter permease [Gemmatimonadales bacterium]
MTEGNRFTEELRLLFRLARLERAARSRRTLLGRSWAVLLPLLEAGVFTLVFGLLLKVRGTGSAYLSFAYVGIYVWRVFARGLTVAASAPDRYGLVLHTFTLPARVPVGASVGSALLEGLLGFPLLLAVVFAVEGLPEAPMLALWLPIGMGIQLGITYGLGLLLAAANSFYRDVGIVLAPALTVLMFAAPVVYPASLVPETLRIPFLANPISTAIECYRAAILGTEAPPAPALATALLLVAIALSLAWVLTAHLDSRMRELL